MRKVILGERPKENEDMIYLRNVPRDGIYTGIAPKVMNLDLKEWEDHYAATGINLEMPSQPTIFASCSDETPLWRPEDNGALTMHDPSRKRILEFDRSNVKKHVKFRVQKKDGTCLYWINYCAVPKEPKGNIVTVREKNDVGTIITKQQTVVKLKTEEDMQGMTIDSYATHLKLVGRLEVKHENDETRNITHEDELFLSCPWWDKSSEVFNRVYIGESIKTRDFRSTVAGWWSDYLHSNLMTAWLQSKGLELLKDSVSKDKTDYQITCYITNSEVETKDANTPQSFSEIECPCIVSSNIVGADDDEFEPHDDEWYVNFNETAIVMLTHAMTVLSTETTSLPAISLIKTNAKHNDYVRVKAHTRNTADEMLSMNTYIDGGYPYTTNKFLTKVVQFDEPIEVNESDGFDCNGNTVKVTTLFAYCPEKDVFIGNSRTVVFPHNIQWIDEPYVYEEN